MHTHKSVATLFSVPGQVVQIQTAVLVFVEDLHLMKKTYDLLRERKQ